jgi:hypothetical protein
MSAIFAAFLPTHEKLPKKNVKATVMNVESDKYLSENGLAPWH